MPSPRKLPHETAIQVLTIGAALPAAVVSLWLLWAGDYPPKVQWTLTVLVLGFWFGCTLAVRERITYPMATLTNLLAALREGDYSLRSRRARRDDALGEVMQEINALGETLLTQRREATEATALLHAVMQEIEVAVFTFDDQEQLQLLNRAGAKLLGRSESDLLGQSASALALTDSLRGAENRTLDQDFPGRTGGRWALRRTQFRENGRPHQLLVLADVSRPLREEERAAWQRLIRVLGHELNNSLAPIQSIAQSLASLLQKPLAARAEDWQEDIDHGLSIIASRAESLGRFLGAYARLARLLAATLRAQPIAPILARAAALETRLTVTFRPGPEVAAKVDGDQLEQALINLIRNAADAALSSGGGVVCGWEMNNATLTIYIDDEGPGLAATTNLFVPFFTTKPEGSGIGLVLSRQIAEAHGGTLTLENRTDGKSGCRAELKLPI